MLKSSLLAVVVLCLASPLALWIQGCSDSELGGAEIPNALPDTYITAETPAPLEASFIMQFHWDGYDPDGAIRGFQWKLSDNGPDGISVHDTLTIDPATGDTINPWHSTVDNDTTLIVTADINGYPPDEELDPYFQRAFQMHTMFVRAIDAEGGIDPSPAFVSFTSTTILPRISVNEPERLANYLDAQAAPTGMVFGYTGNDADFETGIPARIRYLLKPAWLEDHYVRTKYEFDSVMDELVTFADSAWSDWVPFAEDPDDRYVRFQPLPSHDPQGRQILYLFAIQAQDTAGAVSIDRTYARTVHNVFISPGFTPLLTVRERYLGQRLATGMNSRTTSDIAQGQPVEFEWYATAEDYAGVISAYRYGWDLSDPNDPDDPNWAVQPGNSALHRRSPSLSFATGTHTLTVQAWDEAQQMTRFTWILDIAPVPEPWQRRPLLLVDDVHDSASQTWPDAGGRPLDNDYYRDMFWMNVLTGAGGVSNFSISEDVVDTEDQLLSYRKAVNYNTLLWTARFVLDNYIYGNFRPSGAGEQPYNWLQTYQENIGDVFLAGSRIMSQFIEEKRWMLPWVFESLEETYTATSGWWTRTYYVGFGTETLANGSTILRGLQRYPAAAMGLAVLDHTSPKYHIYSIESSDGLASGARDPACVGLKALILDHDFRATHMPEGASFPDTVYTESLIDWRDLDPEYRDQLDNWRWGDDEFYDRNISPRNNLWQLQQCGDQPCVEPMFRAYTRYDWVDDLHKAAGDSIWPLSELGSWGGVLEACGTYAIDIYNPRTDITGATVGFVSHKLEGAGSEGRGDVVWGFDPYRFDHTHIREAIHWVLGEHFGLMMNP